jgi:hypothetical protein
LIVDLAHRGEQARRPRQFRLENSLGAPRESLKQELVSGGWLSRFRLSNAQPMESIEAPGQDDRCSGKYYDIDLFACGLVRGRNTHAFFDVGMLGGVPSVTCLAFLH